MEIVSIVLTEEAAGSHARLRDLTMPLSPARCNWRTRFTKQAYRNPLVAKPTLRRRAFTKFKLTRRDFEEGVRRVQDYIRAGDCYQAVLRNGFQQFKGEALEIYRALRAINPSPYMFFLRMGNETVIGASPEIACGAVTVSASTIAQ